MTRPIAVIHVDDEPGFAEVVGEFLIRVSDDISVTAETDPETVLERIRADPSAVDCIVSDYDMPSTDGLELLKTIRDEWPDLPFILFTGKGSEEIASEAISAGVTEYLQKNTGTETYDVLAHRIRNAVERHRAEIESARTRRFLEKVVERATDVIVLIAPPHDILFVSGSVERVLGYTPRELTEIGPFELIHPDDREQVQTRFAERMANPDGPTGLLHRVRHKNGQYVQLEARAYNLTADEDVEGILVYSRGTESAVSEASEISDESA